MHEAALCSALLEQVARVAREQDAARVVRVRVRIGPLAGVEPELLARAYAVGRIGTVAEEASLEIELATVRVRCRACGREGAASPQQLCCGSCGSADTQLLAGDDLLLTQVELVARLH